MKTWMMVVATILKLDKMLLLLDIVLYLNRNSLQLYLLHNLRQQNKSYYNHIIQYNKIMARIKSETPNLMTYIGHIEGEVSITLSQDKKKLVSLGTDDLILLWNTNDMTSRRQVQLSNPNDQRFCCVQYSQKNGCFYVGSKAGLVYSMPEFDTGKRDIIYRTPHSQSIFALKLTQCSSYLTIAGENTPVLYSVSSRKFWRAEEGHDGTTYYINMMRNLKILTSIGNDGYVNIYNFNSQSLNQTQRSHRFRICHTPSTYPHLFASEHPTKPMLLLPGTYNLQQLHLTWDPSDMTNENRVEKYECNYKINVEIRLQQQILKVCCLTEDIIILFMQGKINFYNYFTKSSLHVINYVDLVTVVADGCGRLWGVIDNGTIYAYDGVCMAEREAVSTKQYFEQLQKVKQAENQFYQPTLQMETLPQPQQKPTIKPKPQISISSMLMSLYPQTAIQSYYPTHMQFRYLFYNEHGCIIKRTDGDEELTQLEYHDRFKIRKIKFETNQLYTYFALTDRCFLYSNLHQFFFQMEVKTYSCKDDGKIAKTNGLVQWNYHVGVIDGLAIGNQWIAVASKEIVYVFDFYGNLLHSICFTRQYLAMCAYEDILVLAYSSSIPYNECYLFEAKIYTVTTNKFKLERKIKVPVKVEEQLKWFGFSQEGCLFNQDTSQTIRMYCWENNQWVNVYEEENKMFKVFIQHIENYQIYGFRIEEKDGEPCGPTVLPKSLPRKIMFVMPDRNLSFLTQEQNKKLQKIVVKRLSLQHEKFRTLRWSKYKYSRKQEPSAVRMSQKIATEQQIKQSYAQLDMHIVQQVSKILPSIESRMQDQQKKQEAKTQLLCLCKNLLFFSESIQKVTQMIGADNYFQFWDRDSEVHGKQIIRSTVVKRLDQMSRLERMVDMGWISSFVQQR